MNQSLYSSCINGSIETFVQLQKTFILSKKAILKGHTNINSKGESIIGEYALIAGDMGHIRWNSHVIIGDKCSLTPATSITNE